MTDERGPDQLTEDLMQVLRCLAATDASRREPLPIERLKPAVRVIAKQIFRIGNNRKRRRRMARQLAGFVVALERYLCRTDELGFSYGPTLHTFTQTAMEWCPGVLRPGDEASRRFREGMIRAVALQMPTDAVEETYEQIVATYRLRPRWAVMFGLSWLFA